jgi:glutamyl-tRNA synthetase
MIVTRFAPSPTGFLHIGGLRTALFNYLWAKRNNGKFLLRIEDTDEKRNSQDATDAIIKAFAWFGMEFDGEVIYQSKRKDIYKKYIQQLLDEDKAYYCYMSKEELDTLREEQMANKQTPRYNGKYRDFKGTPPEGIEPVVRLKIPQNEVVVFNDGVKGENKVDTKELDDFIIARSDGSPVYNFVVTIDDALMGITEVIRGDDHLSNTPKQILIYNALGFDIPLFYHVPMILKDGKKLSKRDGASNVLTYQEDGFLPEALLNFLVRLGWSYGDQEIFTKEEMLNSFEPKDLNSSPSQINEKKLLWLNAHYIKNSNNDYISSLLEPYGVFLSNHDKKEILLDCIKDRANTIVDIKNSVDIILNEPAGYNIQSIEKVMKEDTLDILTKYIKVLEDNKEMLKLPNDFNTISTKFLEDNNLKMPQIGMSLRVAITGTHQAPSIYDILSVIGARESISRIEKFIKNNN